MDSIQIVGVTPSTIKLPVWKNLVEVGKIWGYGSLHPHDEISTILSLNYGTTEYYSNVGRANTELLLIGKLLKSVHGSGYEVVNPDDYPAVVLDLTKKVCRRMKKIVRVTEYAPENDMSPEARYKLREMRDRAIRSLAMTNTDKKDFTRLLKSPGKIHLNQSRV